MSNMLTRPLSGTMTVEQLAKEAGVSVRTIQRWVARKKLPRPRRAFGQGSGRGGPATWPASAGPKARGLKDADRLIKALRRNPIKTLNLLRDGCWV